MSDKHKISSSLRFLPGIVMIAIFAIIILQGITLQRQYRYLNTLVGELIEQEFNQAISEYRTLKVKNLENSISISLTSPNEEDMNQSDIVSRKGETIDNMMYHIMGIVLADYEFDVNAFDSIFNSLILHDQFEIDRAYVIHNRESSDTTTYLFGLNNLRHTNEGITAELDAYKEITLYYSSPTKAIAQQMNPLFIVSIALIVVVIIALIYQLYIIKRERNINAVRKNFTDSMVHELRNPIQSALALSSLVKQNNCDSSISPLVTRLTSNLNNITLLVDEIAQNAFSESLQTAGDLENGNLNEIINQVVEMYDLSQINKKVSYQFDFDPLASNCCFDHLHLPSAIRNLISNAIKYSGREVTVMISTKVMNKTLAISVADNGIGIDQNDLSYIFDKFYRGATSRAKGFGLGLSYVSWVAKIHNGSVSVDSQINQGSTFTIQIPYI